LLHGTVSAPPGSYSVNLTVVDARSCSASNQATSVAPTGGLVLVLVVKPGFSVSQAQAHGTVIDMRLSAPTAGTFSVLATTETATLAAKHSTTRRVTYGSARATLTKAGKVQLKLTPSRAGLALLAKRHRLRLVLAVTFKPRNGKATTRRLHVTVTRS
jgi:hypothetical protein